MKCEEVIVEIETALNAEPNSLTALSRLNEIETYDSVGQLSVIALFDSLFDTVISAKDLVKCKTVSDLINLVKGKLS
jgi:acyl carrier protein